MTRRHWRNPHSTIERYYGLGVMSGNTEGWEWFGHGGGLQGYISFTCVVPERELTVSILTNASDGSAGFWALGRLLGRGGLAHIAAVRDERRAIGKSARLGGAVVERMGRRRAGSRR